MIIMKKTTVIQGVREKDIYKVKTNTGSKIAIMIHELHNNRITNYTLETNNDNPIEYTAEFNDKVSNYIGLHIKIRTSV